MKSLLWHFGEEIVGWHTPEDKFGGKRNFAAYENVPVSKFHNLSPNKDITKTIALWMLAGATPFYALNYCGWNVFLDRTQLKHHHHHHFYRSHYHYHYHCYIFIYYRNIMIIIIFIAVIITIVIFYMYVSTPRPVEKLSCSIQRNKCW